MSNNRWPSWLKRYLADYRRDALVALLLGLVASGCAALLMFTSGYLISATALETTTLFSVMVPIACVQLFGFGRPLARYAERLASHNWVLRVTSDLRVKLFHAIDAMTGDPAQARAAGEYLNVLSDDVAHLQNLYLRVVFPTVVAYALALGSALLFGFFSVPFALIVFIALVGVCVLLPFCSLVATKALATTTRTEKSSEQVSLTDDVSGATDWALSGRESTALERHGAADRAVREREFATRLRLNVVSTLATLALGALLCAALVWAGGQFSDQAGTREACWIAAFALGFFPLIEAFAVLPAAYSETTTHKASVSRLNSYLHADKTELHPIEPVTDPANAVELCSVEYSYPGASEPTLKGISLSLAASQSVAVLGRSGAGKSTLAGVIAGYLTPQNGEVHTAGSTCYLGQTPYLFNRTLRANLKLGNPDASDAELISALESVGLRRKIAELPHGLDAVIGETGMGFSGGEAHRIAFARALLTDSPIIVIDEPFSALDPAAEEHLMNAMFQAFEGRCLVVITHHLAQIKRFDRVIFIEDGAVALNGSPAELARTSTRFQQLVEFDR